MLALNAAIDRPCQMPAKIGAREDKSERPMKVLAATSALSRADIAVSQAHRIARGLGAELLLLHVVDSEKPVRVARRRGALAHSVLEASVRDLRHGSTEISVRSGRPYEIMAEVATQWDADLIVLGPYRRRFGDSLRGTTAERIACKAGRPVLVVNRESADPYQHVLLTADLSRMSAGIAGVTKQLGLLKRSRASVVHALEQTRNGMLYLAGADKTQVRNFEQSMRQLASNEIDTHLFSAGLDSTHFRIFSPQLMPFRAIEQVARVTGSDLVVVGSSRFPFLKRLFFGSVSNEVLRKAKHDVLLVPPAAARRVRRRAAANALHRLETETRQQTLHLH